MSLSKVLSSGSCENAPIAGAAELPVAATLGGIRMPYEGDNNNNSDDLHSAASKQFSVLIAEDNLLIWTIMQKRVIEPVKDGSIVFEMASDGQEAIDKAKEKRYHLIFMDYQMPNCNGVEAVRQIRAFDTDTPIIVQSDSDQTTLETAFQDLSVQGFLHGKLNNLSQVLETVDALELLDKERIEVRLKNI